MDMDGHVRSEPRGYLRIPGFQFASCLRNRHKLTKGYELMSGQSGAQSGESNCLDPCITGSGCSWLTHNCVLYCHCLEDAEKEVAPRTAGYERDREDNTASQSHRRSNHHHRTPMQEVSLIRVVPVEHAKITTRDSSSIGGDDGFASREKTSSGCIPCTETSRLSHLESTITRGCGVNLLAEPPLHSLTKIRIHAVECVYHL